MEDEVLLLFPGMAQFFQKMDQTLKKNARAYEVSREPFDEEEDIHFGEPTPFYIDVSDSEDEFDLDLEEPPPPKPFKFWGPRINLTECSTAKRLCLTFGIGWKLVYKECIEELNLKIQSREQDILDDWIFVDSPNFERRSPEESYRDLKWEYTIPQIRFKYLPRRRLFDPG